MQESKENMKLETRIFKCKVSSFANEIAMTAVRGYPPATKIHVVTNFLAFLFREVGLFKEVKQAVRLKQQINFNQYSSIT